MNAPITNLRKWAELPSVEKMARAVAKSYLGKRSPADVTDLAGDLIMHAVDVWTKYEGDYYRRTFVEYLRPIFGHFCSHWAASKHGLVAEDMTGVELEADDIDHSLESWQERVRARCLEIGEPDLLLVIDGSDGDSCKEMAERYDVTNAGGAPSHAKVSSRQRKAIARLMADEELRDLYIERFGVDALSISYDHPLPPDSDQCLAPQRHTVNHGDACVSVDPGPCDEACRCGHALRRLESQAPIRATTVATVAVESHRPSEQARAVTVMPCGTPVVGVSRSSDSADSSVSRRPRRNRDAGQCASLVVGTSTHPVSSRTPASMVPQDGRFIPQSVDAVPTNTTPARVCERPAAFQVSPHRGNAHAAEALGVRFSCSPQGRCQPTKGGTLARVKYPGWVGNSGSGGGASAPSKVRATERRFDPCHVHKRPRPVSSRRLGMMSSGMGALLSERRRPSSLRMKGRAGMVSARAWSPPLERVRGAPSIVEAMLMHTGPRSQYLGSLSRASPLS